MHFGQFSELDFQQNYAIIKKKNTRNKSRIYKLGSGLSVLRKLSLF